MIKLFFFMVLYMSLTGQVTIDFWTLCVLIASGVWSVITELNAHMRAEINYKRLGHIDDTLEIIIQVLKQR